MTGPHGIEAVSLTKRYGARTVVHDLSFTVRPGSVTGFLGPNGAGKSTTMRMLLGLDTPTRGTATAGVRPHPGHPAPLTEGGALLELPGTEVTRGPADELTVHGTTAAHIGRGVMVLPGVVGMLPCTVVHDAPEYPPGRATTTLMSAEPAAGAASALGLTALRPRRTDV